MIDDVRDMGTVHFGGITKDIILSKVIEINKDYKIMYENGSISDNNILYNDILVAYI